MLSELPFSKKALVHSGVGSATLDVVLQGAFPTACLEEEEAVNRTCLSPSHFAHHHHQGPQNKFSCRTLEPLNDFAEIDKKKTAR